MTINKIPRGILAIMLGIIAIWFLIVLISDAGDKKTDQNIHYIEYIDQIVMAPIPLYQPPATNSCVIY